jgi:hypothetical protein
MNGLGPQAAPLGSTVYTNQIGTWSGRQPVAEFGSKRSAAGVCVAALIGSKTRRPWRMETRGHGPGESSRSGRVTSGTCARRIQFVVDVS